LEQKKLDQALASADQALVRFPLLKKSKLFMAKRSDAGLAAFGECLVQDSQGFRCVDELDTFVKVDPSDSDLAFRAGKVVVEKGHLWQAAPRFFARALADPARRKPGCSDAMVADSLLRSLGQPPDYEVTKAATAIAFEYCYNELAPKLLD